MSAQKQAANPLDSPDLVEVATPRKPWKLFLRFGLLVALVVVGFALARWSPLAQYLEQERLLELFRELREFWWTPILMMVLYTILSSIGLPISPLVVCGGAFYGVINGTILNTIGLVLGSASSYFLARWLGRDFVAHFAGERLKKAERLFDQRGFLPLVQVRFLPVPFWLVNFGAALAGVKAPLFFLASIVGLLPMTLLHTFFAARFGNLAERQAPREEWLWWFAIYATAWGGLALATVGPSLFNAWRRRKRYKKLVAERDRQRAERRGDQ